MTTPAADPAPRCAGLGLAPELLQALTDVGYEAANSELKGHSRRV
jgi:hypothetical protein